MAGEKVAKLGIVREKDMMYYIKDSAVWRVPRKQPGKPKGKPEKVADCDFVRDNDYLYYIDKDGDVSRTKLARGGQKRAKKAVKKAAKKPPKKKAAKKPPKKKAAKKPPKKKAAKGKKR